MSKYNWEEAKILDESGWMDKNYKEMEANVGILLYREEWREGLARAFMLACGYSFEETFHDDNKRFGEFFDTLLDNAAGYGTKNLDDKFSEMVKDFFERNPESAKNVGEMPKEASERQSWSQQLLNEMYYAATKKVMQGDYLDIDYLRAYGDDYGKSVDNMLRGLYECASKSMEERIDEKHPDYSDWHESVYIYLYLYRLAKNPDYKDYLDGKPDSIAPGFLKDGKWVRSAAYDTQTPKFDFSVLPDQLEKTDMFDKVFADFTDNPIVRDEEPIVNRIFIDGKNAYDMFKEKYQGAKNYEEHVKREIMQAVMTGEKRVELARLDLTRNGTPKATVVPVKADLSGFDEGKKWYEHSVAKKAENLWKNDKQRESRIESIKNAVEEKQRAKILSAGYNSTFYNAILAEMNEVRKEFSNPELYVQVHDFNVKLMDMMVEKIPDNISNVKNPENFRNDIRSIRSLLETAGINQEDMKKYGENLTGDAKKTFDSIRKWETEMMKENPKFPIHLPDGITDAKTCVNQMLKVYQNAFYEKCGYVDKLDVDSVERVVNQACNLEYKKAPEKEVKNEVPEKKQVSFNALTKAGMEEHVQQASVRTSNREAEKSTEKGTQTQMVKEKEPAL